MTEVRTKDALLEECCWPLEVPVHGSGPLLRVPEAAFGRKNERDSLCLLLLGARTLVPGARPPSIRSQLSALWHRGIAQNYPHSRARLEPARCKRIPIPPREKERRMYW